MAETESWANTALKDYSLWVFTAVSGFMGFTVWNLNSTVGELAVEMRHQTDQNSRHDDEIAVLRKTISAIRDEQLKRTESVYSSAKIVEQLEATNERLSRVESDRWDKYQHERFVEEELKPLQRELQRLKAGGGG